MKKVQSTAFFSSLWGEYNPKERDVTWTKRNPQRKTRQEEGDDDEEKNDEKERGKGTKIIKLMYLNANKTENWHIRR